MTVSDIAERLRSYGRAASLANPAMTMEGMSVLGYLSNIADELMEVWKEESKAIATENAVLPAVCITGDRAPEKRVADPCWAKTCEKCMEDGLPDGVYCEWYGEPAGCNSPIYGQHPKYEPMCRCPSRMMTLDEAIEHAEECAKDDSPCGQNHRQLAEWLKELRATKSAPIGNSAALRNCDRFQTKEEAAITFAKEKKQWIPQQVLWELAPWLDWLFATATKGEADGVK